MKRWLFMPVPSAIVLVPALVLLLVGILAVGLSAIKAHEGCFSWESSCHTEVQP